MFFVIICKYLCWVDLERLVNDIVIVGFIVVEDEADAWFLMLGRHSVPDIK